MSRRYRPLLGPLALVSMLLLLAGIAPRAVSAHAFLQRTQPANGTIVSPNIGEVRLTFNERVELHPDRVTVTGGDGKRYDLRDAHLDPSDPTTVSISLSQLPNGVYTVRYALLSSDTHPITGTLRFGVGVTPAEVLSGASVTQETGVTGSVLLQGLGRWINLLGLVLLLGPIAFRFFVLGPLRWRGRSLVKATGDAATRLFEARSVRWAWIGVTVLIVGLVVSLIAATIASSLGSAAEALQPAALASTLNGRFGTLWLARLALLLVPALALPVIAADQELGDDAAEEDPAPASGGRGQSGWWAILISGVALALLTTLGGHPSATDPVALSVIVDWVHILATVAWVGGLLTIALILPGVVRSLGGGAGAAALLAVVPRFSALALVCIQALVVTGFYQTWAHVAGPATLGSTAYGRALAVKLLLLVPLLALGAVNRFVVTPRLRAQVATTEPGGSAGADTESPAITRRLWRTIWGEAGLAVAVLAVVGVLTALPPARIQAADGTTAGDTATSATPVGVTLAGSAGALLVNLTIGPTGNGPAVIAVTLRDPQGTTIENAAVTLRATPPGGAAPIEVRLDATGGRYTGLAELGTAGGWKLETLVTPAGGTPATATFALQLPSGGAATLLAGADAAMNQLTSLRERETIGAGGPAVTTDYEWSAPDRLHLKADVGSETFIIGKQRFDRSGTGPWLPSDWPEPQGYRWPQFGFAKTAAEVTLLGREDVDGVSCWIVTFLDTTSDARYTVWIGVQDSRIRQQRMFAVGHYMQSRYFDFNVPITITAPTAP